MRRLCLCLAAVAACAAPAVAQPDPVPKDGMVVIPIVLTPAGVPTLQSNYSLVPQYVDMVPGNRVPGYMKAFMEQENFFSKLPREQREKWRSMPTADLPLAELKNAGILGGLKYRPNNPTIHESAARPLSDVDEAARYTASDWQIWFNIRRDGVATLLPEVQKIRELASVLSLRTRAEIQTGQIDRAVYSLQTFTGIAQSLEQHPTLIGHLVGVAISQIGMNAAEELIQHPATPNLYWSFTEFGQPVLSLKAAYEGERTLISHQFRHMLDADGPVSDAELQKVLRQIKELCQVGSDGKSIIDPTLKYALLTGDAERVKAARKFLIDSGLKAEAVNAMPPLQVTITHDIRQLEAIREDMFKSLPLPYWQAEKFYAAVDQNMRKRMPELLLAPAMLPAVGKVRQAQARLDQRVAILRTIEAVRLHAHTAGKLPEKLSDIAVPVPTDPISGTAFEYAVKDGVATLHGANPMPGSAVMNRYYEIRLRK